MTRQETAVIVGAGPGLSASFARLCAAEGMRVVLAARNIEKLDGLARETGASRHPLRRHRSGRCPPPVRGGRPGSSSLDLVLFNASGRYREKIEAIEPQRLEEAIRVSAFGGFLVAQQAAIRMQKQGHGTILLTGATASVKGLPGSTAFAMGKFALRGMAQCFARELRRRTSTSCTPSSTAASQVPGRGRTRTARIAGSIPTPLRPSTCTCIASHAAPGRGRSSSGRGSKSSEGNGRSARASYGQPDDGRIIGLLRQDFRPAS